MEVELLDLHAVEHLDVAWGSGGGGERWGEMKKVPRKVLWAMPWGNTLLTTTLTCDTAGSNAGIESTVQHA